MDKFNLHEWIGKGEKNLLNEARDDDDFLTTISPEEQGVDPADATVEEDQLDELKMDKYQLTQALDDLSKTREFAEMMNKIGSGEELSKLITKARGGVTKPLMDILRMSGIHITSEFDLLKQSLGGSTVKALIKIVDYLSKEGRINRGLGEQDGEGLEEGQLNEGVLDDLIKAIFSSAAKEVVKKKSEGEVKSLHKKIFGFDYKDRNKKGRAKDL